MLQRRKAAAYMGTLSRDSGMLDSSYATHTLTYANNSVFSRAFCAYENDFISSSHTQLIRFSHKQ